MKKLELKKYAYDIAKENTKTEIYTDFYKAETWDKTVFVYGDEVVAIFSKRTYTLYVFTMFDASVKNKLYSFARKVMAMRIVHLYFRSDCVLETYVDGQPPWKVSKDLYYRIYHNDFNRQIENNGGW